MRQGKNAATFFRPTEKLFSSDTRQSIKRQACGMKKAFQYVKRLLSLFRAVGKLSSTNRLTKKYQNIIREKEMLQENPQNLRNKRNQIPLH